MEDFTRAEEEKLTVLSDLRNTIIDLVQDNSFLKKLNSLLYIK